MTSSLRLRVALAAVAATGLAVLAAGTVLVLVVSADLHRSLDELLARRAGAVAVPAAAAAAVEPGRLRTDGRLTAAGVVVRVLEGERVLLEAGPLPESPLGPSSGPGYATVEVDGEPWRVYAEDLPARPGPLGGRFRAGLTLQVAAPLETTELTVDTVARRARWIGTLAVLAAGALGFAFAEVALRPLRRLRAAAERVTSDRDLTVRVPVGAGPSETDAVARSMNAMLAELERSAAATEVALESSRAFAANAGHELRTPFTVIQTNLEILARDPGMPAADRDALLSEVRTQQARLLRTLDGLHLLARGDLGAGLPSEPLDLADLVDAAVQDARRQWPAADLAFLDPGGEVAVRGWPEGLRVLVDNLLRNAVVHGGRDGRDGRDGRVRVEVAVQRLAGAVLLTVDDDGPGIPATEREHVLGRFARGTGATASGSGLGLALAVQQAVLHGGRLDLGDSPLGGLRAAVTLAN